MKSNGIFCPCMYNVIDMMAKMNYNFRLSYYITKLKIVEILPEQEIFDIQLMQLCTAHTAWSESDQAVQAVHSCSSW